ncbi:MAG: DegT/DnrJ/EryC1/StrS family aminotransferase [Verrucomicrobia bacterium]|nr:DegT/DnrJ/EryC1/StrS family aminotransferase [Verrucomicrobiota bacterium]
MRSIPFHKPSIGREEVDEVVDTLTSGWLTTGPKAKKFEAEFSEYIRMKHSVAVNSCTAALHLALEAIGLRAGETVVVPTMTFAATAEVVRYFNARPLLVDCNLTDFNMDVADAGRRIEGALQKGEKIRAIIPVHYGGQICDMTAVGKLARRYDLKIVEDAAHCCPSYFQASNSAPWQGLGDSSDICCFSFYANKTITTGEGGMACTNNPEYADRMRIMSLHGISRDAWKRFSADGSWYYEITAPGFKYNLTDIAAAIGLHQLRKADEFYCKRMLLADYYTELLCDVDELILPVQWNDRLHSWHLYVIRLKLDQLSIDRAGFIEELKRTGIGTSVHWMPLHMHPYYRATYGYQPGDLPKSRQLYEQIVSLPVYPEMTDADVEYVSETVRRLICKHRKVPAHLLEKRITVGDPVLA